MSYSNEARIKNTSFINKDFQSLWLEVLELAPKFTNKWLPSEANESDPLSMLLKIAALFTDKANYNIDKNILELFPAALTQLRSAYNTYDTLGYNPKWYISATTNVKLNYVSLLTSAVEADEGGKLTLVDGSDYVIGRFTEVCDEDAEVVYTLLEDFVFNPAELSSASIQAIQGTINDFTVNGELRITADYLDAENKLYFEQNNVAQNGIFIFSSPDYSGDLNSWTQVNNLQQVLSGNKVYKFGIDPVTNSIYIQFPDDIGNLIGDGIYIKYILSNGQYGNIKRETLSRFLNSGTAYAVQDTAEVITIDDYFNLTNPLSTQDGTDPADIEDMYRAYKKTVGVFNTLITLTDYENYLYAYTSSLGNPIVSNIRVSDRSNDLYTSYKVRTVTMEGDVTRIEQATEVERHSLTDKTKPETLKALTAYDIRFYPLKGVTSCSSRSMFDNTFESVTSLQAIEDAVLDAKTINHDIKEIGVPIIIDYNLSGKIYLESAVSVHVAEQIKSSINEALYTNFNARELNFGEQPSYSKLIETIQSADSRIKYVALDPINLETIHLPEGVAESDIYKRSVLAGNTPWTSYDTSFNYSYGQTEATLYGESSSQEGGSFDKPIDKIETRVGLTNLTRTKYKVEKGEDIIFYAPKYKTDLTYSNFLFYVIRIGDEVIPANTPYRLSANQHIYLFETKANAKEWGKAGEPENSSLIFADLTNTAIKTDFELRSYDGGFDSASVIPDLSTTKNIYKISHMEGSVVPGVGAYIYAYTNSEKLAQALKNQEPYTLLTGEYFIYTDAQKSDLVILSEGTTIKADTAITDLDPSALSEDGLEEVLNGDISLVEGSWAKIASGVVHYIINQIFIFGEGYEFQFTDGKDFTGWKGDNNPFKLRTDAVLQYKLVSDENSAWTSLPTLLDTVDDYWSGLIRLSLVLQRGEQELGKSSDTDYVTHEQQLVLHSGASEVIIKDCKIQSNSVITLAGGSLDLSDSESKSIQFLSYESSVPLANEGQFSVLPAGQSVDLPGSKRQCLIVPVYAEEGTLEFSIADKTITVEGFSGSKTAKFVYLLIDRSKVEKLANGTSDNLILDASALCKAEAKYYSTEKVDFAAITELLNGSEGCVALDEKSIYVADYDVTYQPSESELIGNPLQLSSYFGASHPANRYVIARLSSTDNLTISTTSVS